MAELDGTRELLPGSADGEGAERRGRLGGDRAEEHVVAPAAAPALALALALVEAGEAPGGPLEGGDGQQVAGGAQGPPLLVQLPGQFLELAGLQGYGR
ncbi:hypothetical protein GCM10020254_01560 [Streptomyces goshikiensis]